MDSNSLISIIMKHFPDASFEAFLDRYKIAHFFDEFQFVDQNGQIIAPWDTTSKHICFFDDIPFYKLPINKLKIWIFPKSIQLCVSVTINSKECNSQPIFINEHINKCRSMLDSLNLPCIFEAMPAFKE